MVGSLLGPCQDFREASAFFGWSANGLQNFAIISVLMDPFPVGKPHGIRIHQDIV